MSKTSLLLIGAITLLTGSLIPSQPDRKLPSSVPLNHFYVVVDSDTYKAIEQSPFLRKEFAVSEQRTTTRTDMSYTGVYFYGDNTYFEFFDASQTAVGRLSDSGLALGVDQAGALASIKTELASRFSLLEDPITRGFEGQQVPWFYMAVPKNFPMSSGLRFWVMEYHPKFLMEWNPRSGDKNDGISRKQILRRYADVLKGVPAKPFLKDVIAITIAADESTQKSLIDLCRHLNYRERVDGRTTILDGDDIEIRLVDETKDARGIQQITMRVTGKPKQTEYRFGARSILKFHGNGQATWSF
ncbi:MAG TPA: DUF5829 family protein [Pyrinomonadaceae bacterium]|nr:DUF5829 family protein [Pyrinomonadaceae bacterium]